MYRQPRFMESVIVLINSFVSKLLTSSMVLVQGNTLLMFQINLPSLQF